MPFDRTFIGHSCAKVKIIFKKNAECLIKCEILVKFALRLQVTIITMNANDVILPKEEKVDYKSRVKTVILDELQQKVIEILLTNKKYREKTYSAKQLARDLGTNTRYVSAVISIRFHMNYASLINKYRIDAAKKMLEDEQNMGMSIEDISDYVGFSNRQSFYSAFYKYNQCTPRQYRLAYGPKPQMPSDNKKETNKKRNKSVKKASTAK